MVWLAEEIILVFESDQDLLSNLWYQPLDISNGTFAKIKAQNRKNEFAILSLSHSSLKANSDVDKLAKLIQHHVGGIVTPSNGDINLTETLLSEYTSQGYNLMIIFGPDTGEAQNAVYQYAYDTYP